MSQVRGRKPTKRTRTRKKEPEPEYFHERTQASSVIFGLVMVVAMIVAGAALLGGSLAQVGQRWASTMDGASRSIGLSVDSIEIVGLEHVPVIARAVESAAMIAPGENMFRADPHTIRRRIEETRMVANVRVYRLWPDTVMIYADAAQPTALWFDGDDWAVVDSLGRQMRGQRASDHLDLIKSVGVGAPDAIPALHTALQSLPDFVGQIEVARRIAERRWDIELKNGALVRLPADEDLATGIASLARANAEGALTRRALAAIDLRVAGRIFLTPNRVTNRVEEAA